MSTMNRSGSIGRFWGSATIRILLLACLLGAVSGLPQVSDVKLRPQAEANPVLTTLASDPDLTSFYSLFNSTGGESGKPGPGFEERFNNPSTGVKYTIFAPTNDAIKKLPKSIIDNLIRPSSFELLSTILRNHIALGELGDAEIGANEVIRFVGGFSIQFDASLGIESNPGTTKSEIPVHHQANLLKDKSGQPIRLQASNGAVYKIDSLLDEFATYFGIDAPGTSNGTPPLQTSAGTMDTVLRTDPGLSELNALYKKLDPDFLTRLSLSSKTPLVYLAPSNAAFDLLPAAAREKFTEPSNFGATSFLLRHGLGTYDPKAGMVRSVDGFNVTIKGDRASNARIQKRICVENGCVWLVGRWLDPIFL
ncbi:hypothetical protein AC579_8118 [Pseudocercospora musae]|uniref:FAS1 domain-containing protein n=1 Tax=Pseudocercospora musae TaxID=113226 RepID=A0A139IG50_9PEZI|nr:hypothetical protein AC579_8118 [Pseudocercospora musae]KXT13685.1 hypothetical protein AC579_8118 [Pseudocercospora musae]